jgi:hypothetical protein
MVRKLLPLVALLAVSGATAASAQAMTVTLGSASLSGRVAVTEPVMVSCTPFDPSLTVVGEGINVTIEQASGRSIAHGTGSSNEFGSGQLFPCDNTSTTIPVAISADTSGPPFHGGTAVITPRQQLTAASHAASSRTASTSSPYKRLPRGPRQYTSTEPAATTLRPEAALAQRHQQPGRSARAIEATNDGIRDSLCHVAPFQREGGQNDVHQRSHP